MLSCALSTGLMLGEAVRLRLPSSVDSESVAKAFQPTVSSPAGADGDSLVNAAFCRRLADSRRIIRRAAEGVRLGPKHT